MAKKNTVVYMCDECGYEQSKWMGKCPSCSTWNSMKEFTKIPEIKSKTGASINREKKPKKITEIENTTYDRLSTDIPELDRVLGGGMVKDSVVLISAAPGTGKSTLLLSVANNTALKGKKVLYESGEESDTQIKSRGIRLYDKNLSENLYIKSTNSMDEMLADIEEMQPDLVIIDSIQTVELASLLPSSPGGMTQVIGCTNALVSVAKSKGIPIFIVGQVTKDSELAGPRQLEHAVDAVLFLEGDENTQLRTARCKKNRFGSTEEIGLFEMTSKGLVSVDNPNELFLTAREEPAVSCALVSVNEGTRSFVVEIQSLVTNCVYGMPIRNTKGISKDDLRILTSMLDAKTPVKVSSKDVSIKVTGGLYIKDVAANLGILMSIVSSCIEEAIPDGYVFIGEVGFTGEITNVQYLSSRIKAIDRYGFKKVFIPQGALGEKIETKNVEIVEVKTLSDVIKKVFQTKK